MQKKYTKKEVIEAFEKAKAMYEEMAIALENGEDDTLPHDEETIRKSWEWVKAFGEVITELKYGNILT